MSFSCSCSCKPIDDGSPVNIARFESNKLQDLVGDCWEGPSMGDIAEAYKAGSGHYPKVEITTKRFGETVSTKHSIWKPGAQDKFI